MDPDQELLCRIAYAIMIATDNVKSEGLTDDALPTAPELAKKLGIKLDKLKKKLKVLKREQLIQSVTLTPKRYRFDFYTLKQMAPDHPLYEGFETATVYLAAMRENPA